MCVFAVVLWAALRVASLVLGTPHSEISGAQWAARVAPALAPDTAHAVTSFVSEGCVAMPGRACSYVATEPGAYRAMGDGWTVKVYTPSSGTTWVYRAGQDWSAGGWIAPDDRVTATAGSGVVRVGMDEPIVPFPGFPGD